MLGPGGNVALGLLLGQKQTRGLNDILCAQVLPGEVRGVTLGADGDALAVNDNDAVLRLHLSGELAVHRVIFQHIGQVIRRA